MHYRSLSSYLAPHYVLLLLGLLFGNLAAAPEVRFSFQEGHTAAVTAIAVDTTDSILYSASADGQLIIWDLASKNQISEQAISSEPINALALSPDNKTLAIACGSKFDSKNPAVYLYKVPSATLAATLVGHRSAPAALAFSPDGQQLLSGGYDKRIVNWSVADGRKISQMEGHRRWVTALAYAPDGKHFASASLDKKIHLWETSDPEPLSTLSGHRADITSLAYSADGQYLFSGSYDPVVIKWDLHSGQQVIRYEEGLRGGVNSIVILDDAELVIAGTDWDKSVFAWDINSGKLQKSYVAHKEPVTALLKSPSAKTLYTASADKTIRVWEVATWDQLHSFAGLKDQIKQVAFSPDNSLLATASTNKMAYIWNLQLSRLQFTLSAHMGPVNDLAFSPSGQKLATVSDDTSVKIWSPKNGRYQRSYLGAKDKLLGVAYLPDASGIVAAAKNGDIYHWDLEEDGRKSTYSGHESFATSIAVAPSGRSFVSASGDNTINYWRLGDLAPYRTYQGHSDDITAVDFSPNGRYVLSGSHDKTIRLWEVNTAQNLKTLTAPKKSAVTAVTFSASGDNFISGDRAGRIHTWSTLDGQYLATFSGHQAGITSLKYSPNNRHIVSSGQDRKTRIWSTSGKEQLQLINLPQGEWVAISPQGFYCSSLHGDTQINITYQDIVLPLARYRKTLYRPQLIKEALSQSSPLSKFSLTKSLQETPPQRFEIVSPPNLTETSKRQLTLKLAIAQSSEPITKIAVFVNGRNAHPADAELYDSTTLAGTMKSELSLELPLQLDDLQNNIRVEIHNQTSYTSRHLEVSYLGTQHQQASKLYAVVIGIGNYLEVKQMRDSKYRNPPKLNQYPTYDTRAIAAALKKYSSKVFGEVVIKTLTAADEKRPTQKQVLAALELFKEAGPNDTCMLFITGHAFFTRGGQSYLMTYDTRFTDKGPDPQTALPWRQIIAALQLPRPISLFLNLSYPKEQLASRRYNWDFTRFAIEIDQLGLEFATNSWHNDPVVGNKNWQGLSAFAFTICNALTGAADTDKNKLITREELTNYLSYSLPLITSGNSKPLISNYPRAELRGISALF